MPTDAFKNGFTDKDKDGGRLGLAGGFGSGFKDGIGALLRDGATAVYVFTCSPESVMKTRRYWLKVPSSDACQEDDLDEEDIVSRGSEEDDSDDQTRLLKLYIASRLIDAPHAVKRLFDFNRKVTRHGSAIASSAPASAASSAQTADVAPAATLAAAALTASEEPATASQVTKARSSAAALRSKAPAATVTPTPTNSAVVAGTVFVVEYVGVGASKAAELRSAASNHLIMGPLPVDVPRIPTRALLFKGGIAPPGLCHVLLVPLSGRDVTRGAKFYLAPGLLFATAGDRNRSDLLDVRVDVVVPGHALRLNRDRVAEWSNVILPYARVVLRAARNEWLSARSPDSPPLPHDIKGMLAVLPPLNRALAAAM